MLPRGVLSGVHRVVETEAGIGRVSGAGSSMEYTRDSPSTECSKGDKARQGR